MVEYRRLVFQENLRLKTRGFFCVGMALYLSMMLVMTLDRFENYNVIKFRKPKSDRPAHPPLINLPVATKILMAAIVIAFVLLWAIQKIVPGFQVDLVYLDYGFVAGKWSGALPLAPADFLSPLTVNFLHAGWMHLGINVFTLAAFAAGIEKRMGPKNMLLIFFLSSALGCLAQFIITPHSQEPLIGASGGISGLFGAVMVMLKHYNLLNGQKLLPMAILWVVISIGFGVMGGPDGESVAWVAHIGGFLAGLGLCWLILNKFRPA